MYWDTRWHPAIFLVSLVKNFSSSYFGKKLTICHRIVLISGSLVKISYRHLKPTNFCGTKIISPEQITLHFKWSIIKSTFSTLDIDILKSVSTNVSDNHSKIACFKPFLCLLFKSRWNFGLTFVNYSSWILLLFLFNL